MNSSIIFHSPAGVSASYTDGSLIIAKPDGHGVCLTGATAAARAESIRAADPVEALASCREILTGKHKKDLT